MVGAHNSSQHTHTLTLPMCGEGRRWEGEHKWTHQIRWGGGGGGGGGAHGGGHTHTYISERIWPVTVCMCTHFNGDADWAVVYTNGATRLCMCGGVMCHYVEDVAASGAL